MYISRLGIVLYLCTACAVQAFPFDRSMPLVLQCRDYLALAGYVPGIVVSGPCLDREVYSEHQGFTEGIEFITRCSDEKYLKLQVQVIYLIREWAMLLEGNLVAQGDVDTSSVQNPDFNKVQKGYVTQLCELLNILLGKIGASDDEWNALQLPCYDTAHASLQKEIEVGKFDWKYYNEYFNTLLESSDESDRE